MSSASALAHRAESALGETLPLLAVERRWSFIDIICIKSALVIASWAFLFGGATAQLVGFVDGLFAIVVGNAIGVLVLLWAFVLPSAKWGTEFFVYMRSILGPVGSSIYVLLLAVITVFAWAAILTAMIGKALAEIAAEAMPDLPIGGPAIATGCALMVLVLAWGFVARGSNALRILNLIAAPALILLCLWLMASLFSQISLEQLVAARPLDGSGDADRAKNLMLAVEINIASGLSTSSLAANLGRYGKSQRTVVWGSFIAYVPIYCLAVAVGLISALALGSADPVSWMLPIVGPIAGIVLLLVLALANFSSLVAMVQGNCQTLIQNLGPRLQSFGWAGFTALVFGGTGVLIIFASDTIYDRFYTLVSFNQGILASLCGVAIADRIVLRRNHLDIGDLYENSQESAFRFWKGINPAAFTSIAIGFYVYLMLFNPITYETAFLFTFVSATFPALIAAFFAHLLLTRIVVIPAGKGSYPTVA